MDFTDITEKFGLADIVSVNELKTGHINKTYCIECGSGKYIMQSLNRDIFRNPEVIMNNISLIEQAFESEKSIVIPHYLLCNGRNYIEQNGEIWRICGYIENNPHCINKNYSHGYAVGRFLDVVNSGSFEFEVPVNLHNFKLPLPLRNIHGDTKADNIIFGDKPAIIDFDMAMRGYICADYGDMIRSVTTGNFDLQTIREVTQGFADGIGGFLTDDEIFSLDAGIAMIISELIGRYHEGNKNFPNKTPEQCLERENELKIQINKFFKHQMVIKEIINRCFSDCFD